MLPIEVGFWEENTKFLSAKLICHLTFQRWVIIVRRCHIALLLTDLEDIFGYVFGITSSLFYLSARIPQILQNYNRQSVEGLSMFMFIISVLGNSTYGCSILMQSIENLFILRHLPWLVGSLALNPVPPNPVPPNPVPPNPVPPNPVPLNPVPPNPVPPNPVPPNPVPPNPVPPNPVPPNPVPPNPVPPNPVPPNPVALNPVPLNPVPPNPVALNPVPPNPVPPNPVALNPVPLNPVPLNPVPLNPVPLNPVPNPVAPISVAQNPVAPISVVLNPAAPNPPLQKFPIGFLKSYRILKNPIGLFMKSYRTFHEIL
uniref:SH3 domain-containing protein C23A1.17-like n=1 Tax=Saccoglossus kowalevskii TaxID=10224 RepID=A0ABM0M2T6_SACKO|nr:PREDICTED: SH3 domain-containing protein C23A1.17-like [Saccoglossus kowalevskii]